MKKYKSYILGGSMILLLLLVLQVASDTGIFGKYDIDRGKLMLPSPVFVFVRLIELITLRTKWGVERERALCE